MMDVKSHIEKRMHDLEQEIAQQKIQIQQLTNRTLILHGAKEECSVLLKKMNETHSEDKLNG